MHGHNEHGGSGRLAGANLSVSSRETLMVRHDNGAPNSRIASMQVREPGLAKTVGDGSDNGAADLLQVNV